MGKYIFIILACLSFITYAQNWQPFNQTGEYFYTNNQVHKVEVDSIENLGSLVRYYLSDELFNCSDFPLLCGNSYFINYKDKMPGYLGNVIEYDINEKTYKLFFNNIDTIVINITFSNILIGDSIRNLNLNYTTEYLLNYGIDSVCYLHLNNNKYFKISKNNGFLAITNIFNNLSKSFLIEPKITHKPSNFFKIYGCEVGDSVTICSYNSFYMRLIGTSWIKYFKNNICVSKNIPQDSSYIEFIFKTNYYIWNYSLTTTGNPTGWDTVKSYYPNTYFDTVRIYKNNYTDISFNSYNDQSKILCANNQYINEGDLFYLNYYTGYDYDTINNNYYWHNIFSTNPPTESRQHFKRMLNGYGDLSFKIGNIVINGDKSVVAYSKNNGESYGDFLKHYNMINFTSSLNIKNDYYEILKIFPSVSQSEFFLNHNGLVENIKIYNTLGIEINSINIIELSSDLIKIIFNNFVADGIYIIHITIDGKTKYFKILLKK